MAPKKPPVEEQHQQEKPANNVAVEIKERETIEEVPTVVVASYTSVYDMYKMMGLVTADTEIMQVFEKIDESGNKISGKELFAGKRVIGRVPFYMLTEAHSYVNINIHRGESRIRIEDSSPRDLMSRASIPVEYKITPTEIDYEDFETDHIILHSKWPQTFYEFLAALEFFSKGHEGKVFISERASTGDIKDKYLYSNNCPFTLIASAKAYVDLNFPGFRLNDPDMGQFTVEDALNFGRIPSAYSVSRIRVFSFKHE